MNNTLRIVWFTLVFGFLYLPILILMGNSFNASRYGLQWKGFTFKWYESMMHNASLIDAAVHSMTIGLCAASIATLIGTITAVALFRHQFKGKKLLHGLLFIIISSPDIILAISLLILFLFVGIKLGFISLLIAHITFCLPFVTYCTEGFGPLTFFCYTTYFALIWKGWGADYMFSIFSPHNFIQSLRAFRRARLEAKGKIEKHE